MLRQLSFLIILIGAGLTIATLYGAAFDSYERPEEAKPVAAVVAKIDEAWAAYRWGKIDQWQFLERATHAYAEGIDYFWPKYRAGVAFTDNWILWLMAYADPILNHLGLTKVEGLFTAYETTDWRRALERGYGICSQNALGLTSLLRSRYGVEADIIGLDGHVVVEAKGYLLDPSVGLALPFSLPEAARREKETGAVSEIYRNSFTRNDVTRIYGFDGQLEKEAPYAELGQFYDAKGNRRIGGVEDYRPKLYWFERASDWLKWVLPLLMILVGVWCFQRRRCDQSGVVKS